jgi:tetratricopeptide (TPR) repeat protein
MLAGLAYGSSLRGHFAGDDHTLIIGNPDFHNLANAPRMFTIGFANKDYDPNPIYYRPLVAVSFQLDHAIYGMRPFGFRLTNLMLHAVAVVLVFFLARRLTESPHPAGLAATLFAVHPSHAESVAWISQRTDVIATVFSLASCLVLLRDVRFALLRAIVVCAFVLLALTAKENAIVMPVILIAMVFTQGGKSRMAEAAKWAAALLVVVAIYAALRINAIGAVPQTPIGFMLGRRVLCVGIAFAAYLRMLFVPLETCPIYDVFSFGARYPWLAVAAWTLPVGLAALAVWARRVQSLLALCALWLLLTILPVCNILPTLGPLPAERFVYLPSVASSILFGLLARKLWRYRPPGLRVAGAGSSMLIAGFVVYCLGLCLSSASIYTTDLNWARRVDEIGPRFTVYRVMIADIFRENGVLDAAERNYLWAIASIHRRDPGVVASRQIAAAFTGMASLRRMAGKFDEALAILDAGAREMGDNADIRYDRGVTYARMGNLNLARQNFALAAKWDPTNGLAWRSLAKAEHALGILPEAAKSYEQALKNGKLSITDRLEMAEIYRKLGRKIQARAHYRYVIARARGHALVDKAKAGLDNIGPK